jgi:hypothetical protein
LERKSKLTKKQNASLPFGDVQWSAVDAHDVGGRPALEECIHGIQTSAVTRQVQGRLSGATQGDFFNSYKRTKAKNGGGCVLGGGIHVEVPLPAREQESDRC